MLGNARIFPCNLNSPSLYGCIKTQSNDKITEYFFYDTPATFSTRDQQFSENEAAV